MDPMTHREVACAILVDDSGQLLLQQRDDVPGILCPGLIGFFGGHRENGETFLECVVREVFEEIGYYIPPAGFTRLLTYDGEDVDAGVGAGTLYAEIFVAGGVPRDRLVITEGALLVVPRNEVAALETRLTPLLRRALPAILTR
jgi:8-oxo-dGTP pyrophosphatase MutT (NUDIX family)